MEPDDKNTLKKSQVPFAEDAVEAIFTIKCLDFKILDYKIIVRCWTL